MKLNGAIPFHRLNADETWPELIPIETPAISCKKQLELPGDIGAYAKAVDNEIEAPAGMAALAILAIASIAVARVMNVRIRPGHVEPCNLWTLFLLPSGERKSAVAKRIFFPLDHWEQKQAKMVQENNNSQKAKARKLELLIDRKKREASRCKEEDRLNKLAEDIASLEMEREAMAFADFILQTADCTPEKLAQLMARNSGFLALVSYETGALDPFLGRYGNGRPNIDLLLKAFSGDPERIDRLTRAGVRLEYPRLAMFLGGQPEAFLHVRHMGFLEKRGFLARLLFYMPPSLVGRRSFQGPSVPPDLEKKYRQTIESMLNWLPDRGALPAEEMYEVHLSEDAEKLYISYAQKIENLMQEGGELEGLRGWGSKAPGMSARIAAILHAMKHAHERPWDLPISGETMQQAIDIMEAFKAHMLAFHTFRATSHAERKIPKIIETLKQAPQSTMSVKELFDRLRSHFKRVDELRNALDLLEEHGYVRITQVLRNGPGRPSSPQITLRPDLNCTEKAS